MTGDSEQTQVRVLFASHSASHRGGAELCLLQLACELQRDGRIRPMAVVTANGTLGDMLRAASIPVAVTSNPRWTISVSHTARPAYRAALMRASIAFATLRRVPTWTRLLRRLQPDVVVTLTATTALPALAARAARIPHVWWVHEFVNADLGYAIGEPVAQRLIGALSQAVIVNSRALQGHLCPPISAAKVTVIYPSIDDPEVRPSAIRPGELRLLMLGRRSQSKGCELALEALARSQRLDNLKLRMVGSTPPDYQLLLEKLAEDLGVSDRVEFFDHTDEPIEHLEWCNALVMASVNEAFGRVTAEALKAGRPVIGLRCGGTAEIVTDRVDGILVEPGDPFELAAAFDELASDHALLARLSNNASQMNRSRYTIARDLSTYVEIFLDAARRRPRVTRRSAARPMRTT